MTIYCYQCGAYKPVVRHAVKVTGYWPSKLGGIMIPESVRETSFCSRECFIKWMIAAVDYEPITSPSQNCSPSAAAEPRP
jgi:hypothetical protein